MGGMIACTNLEDFYRMWYRLLKKGINARWLMRGKVLFIVSENVHNKIINHERINP